MHKVKYITIYIYITIFTFLYSNELHSILLNFPMKAINLRLINSTHVMYLGRAETIICPDF